MLSRGYVFGGDFVVACSHDLLWMQEESSGMDLSQLVCRICVPQHLSFLSPVFLWLGSLGLFLPDLHDLTSNRFQHCNLRGRFLDRNISRLLPVEAGHCRFFLRFWNIT